MPEAIKNVISKIHGADEKQLDIIFSSNNRLIVEAPAGCGKTTTLVSKIAYMICSGAVGKNKKILCLTFSVNAAYKMKKDLAEKLPQIGFDEIREPADLNRMLFVSNYHGLCRRILSLYGYLLHENMPMVNYFKVCGEADKSFSEFLDSESIELSDSERLSLSEFGKAVSSCDGDKVVDEIDTYNNILLTKFIPKKCITYNAYISLAIKLFRDNPNLLRFYQKLFPAIVIDEFQDTNYLSWYLVKELIDTTTNLFFVGDPLQRIYGFIGAVPDLMRIASVDYAMEAKSLEKNYRFKDNEEMLNLDKNIRANASDYLSHHISKNAVVNFHYADTHEAESSWIARKIIEIQCSEDNHRIAILVQQRGTCINMIMKELEENNISFFYALFSDDDGQYVGYHYKALEVLREVLSNSRYHRVTKSVLKKTMNKIQELYAGSVSKTIDSLIDLTEGFFARVVEEYSFLNDDEKYILICDAFENRSLKQNMDVINARVFVSTVHGAKGLEWESVFIPDMEPYCFPNYNSLCGSCDFKTGRVTTADTCKINIADHDEKKYLEELSVFYVAVTRARKSLFFSASKTRYNNDNEKKNSKISCLMFIPGIELKSYS